MSDWLPARIYLHIPVQQLPGTLHRAAASAIHGYCKRSVQLTTRSFLGHVLFQQPSERSDPAADFVLSCSSSEAVVMEQDTEESSHV